MDAPQAVESVEIQILVDNVTDSLSTVPSFVETEWAGLGRRRQGSWVLAGSCMCCAAHGLSCVITVRKGAAARTLLFDSGPEDAVFEQNVSRLGVNLGPVETIVPVMADALSPTMLIQTCSGHGRLRCQTVRCAFWRMYPASRI
jgi:7,8-dihydropterin-6-yl-methyl-4-(beta-D-ribofuranosyl)aminobenzene 5'-phosphate synthase